jgi:UDP-N-acetyl-D-galactosamine dehydrogenase
MGACALIGPRLTPGSVVVFESTVYPSLTREYCGRLLAKSSELRQGVDFKLGYSHERINPGDKQHRLETIVKIVAGEDQETLERVAGVYARVAKAGIYRASSLDVAEAAKVIENTQRDLNIALMNELAIIFDRLGIPTKEVLQAGGDEMEFPSVHAGPGRRALHRRRSLLPDRQGRGRGLFSAGHPLWPPH